MSGQVGVEYLIITGFFLLLVGILTSYYDSTSTDNTVEMLVTTSIDNFKSTADKVFALGKPASDRVKVSLPDSINSSRTLVNGTLVQISYHNQNGNLVDVVRALEYNVSGVFPNESGSYEVRIRSLGVAGVEVSFT